MIRWGWNMERYEQVFENEYSEYFDSVHAFGCEKTQRDFETWSMLGFEDEISGEPSSVEIERIYVAVAMFLFNGIAYNVEPEIGSNKNAGIIWILVDTQKKTDPMPSKRSGYNDKSPRIAIIGLAVTLAVLSVITLLSKAGIDYVPQPSRSPGYEPRERNGPIHHF